MTQAASVSRTGHTTAWARALARKTYPKEIANDDYCAEWFLLPHQRFLNRVPRVAEWLAENRAPGAIGYFNARTRWFDGVVRASPGGRVEQLVVLGAGFDSRALRFADRIIRAFEVDQPHVLDAKARHLARVKARSPAKLVPIDFSCERLEQALLSNGYKPEVPTLFLWEGVTYYLDADRVDAVLEFVGRDSASGSRVAFDYVTRAFFEGDHTSYGARQLAAGWRRMGNVHRSGIASASELVARRGLDLTEDIDVPELERRYLTPSAGLPRRAWGCFRAACAMVP